MAPGASTASVQQASTARRRSRRPPRAEVVLAEATRFERVERPARSRSALSRRPWTGSRPPGGADRDRAGDPLDPFACGVDGEVAADARSAGADAAAGRRRRGEARRSRHPGRRPRARPGDIRSSASPWPRWSRASWRASAVRLAEAAEVGVVLLAWSRRRGGMTTPGQGGSDRGEPEASRACPLSCYHHVSVSVGFPASAIARSWKSEGDRAP